MRYVVRRETRRNARVSIGIPTYNGVERTGWLLQTLQRTLPSRTGVALTLLDDGSPKSDQREGIVALAHQYDANCLVHTKNEGITKSWNDLVRFVDSEFSILLNDDLLLTEKWLENLIYFLENNACCAASPETFFFIPEDVSAILNGQTVWPRDQFTKAHRPELLTQQSPEQAPGCVMCPLGCSFGFLRTVYDQLGGFDERTRNFYNESWFGTKAARDLKLPTYVIPAPRIWHLWSATFSSNPGLQTNINQDQAAYIAEFGGKFDVTHPRFMHGTMPPRIVKWLGSDGLPRELELTIQ